jgi:hypothetical protein
MLSCSKKDDPVTHITKQDIIGEWTISETPAIKPVIAGESNKQYEQRIKDTLELLFKVNDKYLFNEDGSCTVTRDNSTRTMTYAVDDKSGYLTFKGYIKFVTNVSSNKLVLTAGTDEIRGIVKEELKKLTEYDDSTITSILKTVSGDARLVLTKKQE